jgi:hypothetical protein
MGQSTPIGGYDAFDPETLSSLCRSYDRALDILMQTGELRSANDPVSEILARRIIALAHRGERDPYRLTIGALKFIRSMPMPPLRSV